MFSTFVTCILLLLAKFVFLRMLLDFTQDSQEPPPVDLWLPFIGPIVRMGWTGFAYYTKNRRFPICTIRLPGIRLYVVNSTSLVSAVQYHPRTFSFAPMLARVASNLIGASKSGVEVLSDHKENGFIKRFHDFNQANLLTGPGLDALRTKYWSLITSYHFQRSANVPKNIRMYEWISHEVMMATSDAIYGTQNPFRDSTTREFYKKYESGMLLLLAGLMQSLTSKRSLRAREALVRSFEQYYNSEGFENEEASPYIRDQYRIFSESGLSDQDIAKTSAAFSIALMGNTMPATFWLVYHIFSNETILQDCRKELLAASQKSRNGGISLDPMSIEQSCPILLSTLKETLRTHSMGTSVTQVVEDQVIDNQYLLKKGALVLIPAVIQHSDQSAWGENVNDFDYLRFVRASSNRIKSWNPVAYRVFGGGWTLCPGRHVATSFMLGFAASAIMSFDIQPSSGRWVIPTVKNSNLATTINQPDEDLDIQLHYREDSEWANSFIQLEPRV